MKPNLTRPKKPLTELKSIMYKAMEYGFFLTKNNDIRVYMSKWFNNCDPNDIYYDNFKEWISWSTFVTTNYKQLNYN